MQPNKTRACVSRHCLSVVGLLLVCLSAQAAGPTLLEPDSPVGGFSQAEWTRAWWQWAASFDGSSGPVADMTGRLCASGQQGPVWFLAGTYGTARTIRTCTVPSGKYLFFPLINYLMFPRPHDVASCNQLVKDAKRYTEGVSNLVLRVDGREIDGLGAQRMSSQGCFDLGKRQTPSDVI